MIELNGDVKIYAETIESEAIGQITQMANSPIGQETHIRIMPDAHAGAGCVIGTTMKIANKVCPNLVGVDIGCGVNLVQTNIDFKKQLERLDRIIKQNVPSGRNVHKDVRMDEKILDAELNCWEYLGKAAHLNASCALGTLGGGNHFIEAYEDGFIAVHSGSRNLGLQIAKYYQNLATKRFDDLAKQTKMIKLKEIPEKERQGYLSQIKRTPVDKDLLWLENGDLDEYLEDANFATYFAERSREVMLETIIEKMGGKIIDSITSTHNYIGQDKILRKGAIQAYEGQKLVIPMSMRDGMLICTGKGNEDWNYSAPHGAGRLYSRSAAKREFTLEQYQESMEGIYSTCINQSTLDEAPFAYKNWEEIARLIEPTVKINERIIPIYNFKASES